MKMLWFDRFLRREPPADDGAAKRPEVVFAKLASEIARRVPATKDLESRLRMLARSVGEIPEVAGAMVVACDVDGTPVGYGLDRIAITNGTPPYKFLRTLKEELPPGNGWVELEDDLRRQLQVSAVEGPAAAVLRARHLGDHNGLSPAAIVVALADGVHEPLLDDLEESLKCLSWMVHDSLRLEETSCIEELRQLEMEELGLVRSIEPAAVARKLQKIFAADAVTILWREQGSLYLSATTDEELLKQRDVVYDPGKGFTGLMLETGKSILLRNARDKREIRRVLGKAVAKKRGNVAVYPEKLADSGDPFQFLAVPMRIGKDVAPYDQTSKRDSTPVVLGVIRILRKESDPPFTGAERAALQHFGDIFGLALLSAWRWFLTEHILKAETEAICITRNDVKKDKDGRSIPRVVYGDPGAELLFGLKNRNNDGSAANQLYGMDSRRLYADGEYEKIRKSLSEAIAQGKEVCGPIKTKVHRFVGKSVEVRSAEISYRHLSSPFVIPATRYTIAVVRDITEDQRLVALLNKRKVAYFRAGIDGVTKESSKAEALITGYSSDELERMQRRGLYLIPEDREILLERVRRADGNLVEATQRLKKKDGTWFWAEGVIQLLKDNDGNESGYEGLYEDVTDRLQLEGFLDIDPGKLPKAREIEEKLKESARLQLLLMTSLSHQLRSPIGALVMHLEDFSNGLVDASRFSSDLKYSIGQAKVCRQLVANLTYMDKILRSESFDFDRVNMARLAIDTKLDYAQAAQKERLKIEVDGPSIDRYLEVWGHEGLLRQVLINLFDNAIRYSLPDSVIRVCGAQDVGRNYLQVSNRGLRVPRKDRERIFEQGVRLAKAQALIPDGTGLGLWLVKKIIDAHDAEIRCTEVFEGGSDRTAFQIVFPINRLDRSVDRWKSHE